MVSSSRNSTAKPRIRIGVDVGGTFTDFVLVDERRDVIYTGKRLTTADDPSIAITQGIERLLGEVYFLDTGFLPCPVYDRYALHVGETFRGPAVIEERESTTVVGPDAQVIVDKYLNLIIDID
jgi:N-methylhydantoinase A/oxoprolinase/acetone carboxylase beta subunit